MTEKTIWTKTKDLFEGTIFPAGQRIGAVTAIIAVGALLYSGFTFYQRTMARIDKLEASILEANLDAARRVRDEAKLAINREANTVMRAIELEKADLHKLRAEMREQEQRNSTSFARLEKEIDTTLNAFAVNLEERFVDLSGETTTTLQDLTRQMEEQNRLNKKEFARLSEASEDQQNRNARRFEADLDQEVEAFQLEVNRLIADRVALFNQGLDAIPATLEKLEAAEARVASLETGFQTLIGGLAEQVRDFDGIIRSYQRSTEDRFDKFDRLPNGALILVSGSGACPRGFEAFASTLFFAFKDEMSLVSKEDFKQDSSYDIGLVRQSGAGVLGKLGNGHSRNDLSYDGKLVRVCRAVS